MIQVQFIDQNGQKVVGGKELIAEAQKNPKTKYWVDMEIGDKAEDIAFLSSLGCHILAIEDALRYRHPPKIEYFSEHVFILFRGILDEGENLNMRHMQIAFFVTEQSIITVRHGHSKGVEKVWNLTTDSPLYENGLNTALKVMRTSSNLYLEQILLFEAKVTDLEDALQKNGNDKMMAELVTFRSRLVKLRRIFNYHKSISQGLSSDQASRSPYVTKDNAHEIIDLQDIFERLFSLSQMHYDICGDLLDGYLSISSHQLNVTMRVLTVITAVFVPLSFLAGLYGMNFDSIPELHWEYGYFILLGVMFTLAVGLIYIFKRKNWM